ncbi:MAG: PAAR-like domain-containing protein, partial [Desulforhopalus sp.]
MSKKGNVLINGRTVVHKESGGVLITTDVCLTKIGKSTVPIPYTNVARSVDADNTSSTVFVNGHPICHKNSIFSKSTGDEPGNRLGIRSGTITGKAEFITGSPNVFIEGIPAVRQGDMMVSNNCNTAPMPLSQPGAPIVRNFKLSQVTPPEETELPDKVVLGQSGEQAPLLRGLYRGDNGSNTAKTATGRKIFQYIEQEGSGGYRELLINNLDAGTHQLSLLLNDKEFDLTDEEDREYIVIPLGQTETVKKDSSQPRSPEEFTNFTVPIIPKRYTTTEFDKAKTADLRSGWLYIYRNGYLWRELQVRENSFMADVNLRRHQGENTRPASGESDSRVIVPWKIDNQLQTIEIAFSEVQWSWARINALGGMDPDKNKEPRLNDTTPMPTLPASETAKNRQERMQDITGELGQWLLGAGQDTENIQSAENVTSEIFTMLLHKNSKMPVLFLQDHLALLRQMAYKAHQAADELDKMHRRDDDAHKRTIADIAISILDSYPDYSKHLRSHEDMHVFCNNFDGRLRQLQHNYNMAQDDLINFLQEKRPVFMTIWDDYSTDRANVPDHQQDLEEVWYSFLSAISPFVSRETAVGEATTTEEPDRLARLLGSFKEPTPEGEAFFDRVFLVSDRATGHTDNLVGLLGNFLAKQQSTTVIERIFERYRLSGHKITWEFPEIVFVPGNYLDKLPGQLRWGTAIDSVTGKPVTAIKGGKIIVPQLFVNGKAINTMETTVGKVSVETVRETVREQSRVRLREKPLGKVHIGLRGLQILNV